MSHPHMGPGLEKLIARGQLTSLAVRPHVHALSTAVMWNWEVIFVGKHILSAGLFPVLLAGSL